MPRPNKGDNLKMAGRLRPAAANATLAPAGRDDRKGVQSVDIAFSILRALEGAAGPLTLRVLADRVGQQSSKVHHYLVSLIRNGVVIQNAAGHYDLGSFALQLGLSALSRLDFIEKSVEAVTAFRDETGESAFVAVWGNRGPTIVRYVEGTRPVTVEVRAGLVLPLVSSATGHIFMTWLPEALWSPIAQWEIDSAERLRQSNFQKEIAKVRKATAHDGIATIDGDVLPRIAAISAPVFNHEARLVCALTTLGWRGELDIAPDSKTSRHLLRTSQVLSKEIGFRGENSEVQTKI